MGRALRILVVEDQQLVAAACERQLASAGFESAGIAANAAEALVLAHSKRPDLIVMDIRLAGGVDGIDTALDIYQRLGIRSIFASAHVTDERRVRAQGACPLGWLEKPYTGAELLETVKRAGLQLQRPPSQGNAPRVIPTSTSGYEDAQD